MKTSMIVLLLAATCSISLACLSGGSGPFDQLILSELVGPFVSQEPWVGSSGGSNPVEGEGQLDCNFDSACCYNNAIEPEDKYDWVLAKGFTDPFKIQTNFASSVSPTGNFLIASAIGVTDTEDARFGSCTIPCTDQPVTVTLRHWRAGLAVLQVCKRDSFYLSTAPLYDCQDVPYSATAGPTSVVLPPGEFFDVVIVAKQFTAGAAVMIDDIKVDYSICPLTTTTETTTTMTTTTPGPITVSPEEECFATQCEFEYGDSCSYTDTFLEGDVAMQTTTAFEVVTGRFGNRITGVPGPSTGEYYIAAYLDDGDRAAMSTEVDFAEDRVIKFDYYEATSGMLFKACCNDENDCPIMSLAHAQVTDREWKSASFICLAGTSKVLFVCENLYTNEGGCGIDNIQLYVDDGGDPDNASTSVCPGLFF